ncbi:hypothetical protein EJ06DRAFT_335052 [Trichodelitschia bisporula]|uniref:Chromosome segregation ATPase family protein n=1 Tax=Trichodelitschia bisporula TaxID=703511 RepID=A0A6G1I2J7_9PEZI|nr:hypothetical protein EJ06DRAFT_335052 [Trichodelitschia bisporula]
MSFERDRSRDRDILTSKVSAEHIRSIPMWDSSDPDRAPPPLPMNPGSPSVPRAGVSGPIAAMQAALENKAREATSPAPYVSNPSPSKSAAHRRLQSLQTPSVRDLRYSLDPANATRSPDRSPERPGSSMRNIQSSHAHAVQPPPGLFARDRSRDRDQLERDRDIFNSSPEKSPRATTPTPNPRDILRDNRSARSNSRPPQRPILGESSPSSATMIALQTMSVRDFNEPLSERVNGVKNKTGDSDNNESKAARRRMDDFPEPIGAISSQILSLTTICTNLQREMAQLSRRSKDNATDLISLKEATNSRDEDIRRSLRQLLESINAGRAAVDAANQAHPIPAGPARQPYHHVHPHVTPPPHAKTFASPGVQPSPAVEAQHFIGPINYSLDGSAGIAMLEKIMREMSTKEGQERLLVQLSGLLDKASQESSETARKVAELLDFIKTQGGNGALVKSRTTTPVATPEQSIPVPETPSPSTKRSKSESPTPTQAGPLTRTTRDVQFSPLKGSPGESAKPYSSPKAADFVSDEMIKLLKKIRDGVTASGSIMGDLKSSQRDLRGDILHMGQELARKIDEARKPAGTARAIEDGSGKQDIARIVQEGLAELKEHLDTVMREKRRQSGGSVTSRTTVDSREVYDVVKHALAERGLDFDSPTPTQSVAPIVEGLDKEAILEAVKEAYEEYKPNIELQQFGLERDEILHCLKEGLEEYRTKADAPPSISRDEMMDAIHAAMEDFKPPPPIDEGRELREEVLTAVRECLDEFRPSLALTKVPSEKDRDRELDVTREVVLDAVRAGMASSGTGPSAPKELQISRDELYDAIKAALESSGSPLGQYGEQVVNQLHALVQEMRAEFKDYSTANGRDTEQVLDAMKDGLETLRGEVEAYFDRAQDVSRQDEVMDTITKGLDALRDDVQVYCAAGPQGENALNKAELLSYIKSEFEHLHDSLGNQMVPASGSGSGSGDLEKMLGAVQSGFEDLQSKLNSSSLIAPPHAEDFNQSIKEELEHLRETLATTLARSTSDDDKDDMIDTVRETVESMIGQLGKEQGEAANQHLSIIQGEIEHLREAIATTMTNDKDEDLMASFQAALESLHERLVTSQADASRESLHAVQESLSGMQTELERLNSTLGNSMVRGTPTEDKEQILEALRSTIAAVREAADGSSGTAINEATLDALRREFESLRSGISTTIGRAASKSDTDELVDTIRLGLDDLRAHLDKKIDNPDPFMRITSEVLDALNEGIDGLKTDVAKMLEKPNDMSVSYEILDTLKEGLASLREDMDKLKSAQRDFEDRTETRVETRAHSPAPTGHEIVLAEGPEESTSREVAPALSVPRFDAPENMLQRNDIEKMEVILSQMQSKIESIDINVQETPAPPMVQMEAPEDMVRKADLEGIEAVLHEIKDIKDTFDLLAAKELDKEALPKKEDIDAIETLVINAKETQATREQIESLDALLKSTREAVDDVSARMDDKIASKEDLAVIEVLVQDAKAVIDDIRSQAAQFAEEEQADKVGKKDLDVIGLLCLEIKDKIAGLDLPEPDSLPNKADVEQLIGLVNDFRESHDKLKDNYETDIAVTAKAFDDRRKEAEDIIAAVGLVRSFMDDVKEELKSKLDTSSIDVSALGENMKALEEAIGSSFNVKADVNELMEIVSREFERMSGAHEDAKLDRERKTEQMHEKQNEIKDMLLEEISAKLEDKFGAIMLKYEEAQTAAANQVLAMEERAAEQAGVMTNTKDVADELKLSVDTLGCSITTMETTFRDVAGKISEESQTVFMKLDEGFSKIDDIETRTAAQEEHDLTRQEVSKALTAITGLQGEVTEFNPKVLSTLQEVLTVINSHYEQTREATEHTRSLTDEIKNSFTALPALMPPPPPVAEVKEYDDTLVQDKLDQLMTHVAEAKEASTQLDRLDKIHHQVMVTAAEFSDFVALQTRLITEGHESKEKEVEETTRLLERRLAEKEHVESDVEKLRKEKEELSLIVERLHEEKESLLNQKARLSADVSAVQTALTIRKEELHQMDAKAEILEKRILDGIINQSRVYTAHKGSKSVHSRNGSSDQPSPAAQGLSLAIKNRSSPARRAGGPLAGGAATGRRIFSANYASNQQPSFESNVMNTGGVKRSQSVRNSTGMRKVSTLSDKGDKRRSFGGAISEDKENDEYLDAIDSEDEQDEHDVTGSFADEHEHYGHEEGTNGSIVGSETDAERRISAGQMTDSGASYETGYLTGTESDRRSSYGSTAKGVVAMASRSMADFADVADASKMVVYAPPSDSGLGADLPPDHETD